MDGRLQGCDVEALNRLLRGELSAVETYTQAIEKFADSDVISELRAMRGEHVGAVRTLEDQVIRFGGTPSRSSGAWGAFVAAVSGAAKVIGHGTILAALREGEEIGIADYEAALAHEDLHPECLRVIRTDLLPACRAHVASLEALVNSIS